LPVAVCGAAMMGVGGCVVVFCLCRSGAWAAVLSLCSACRPNRKWRRDPLDRGAELKVDDFSDMPTSRSSECFRVDDSFDGTDQRGDDRRM